VAGVGTPPAQYTIKTMYKKIDDAYEPNDTREMAKPITIGTPITASLYAGFRSGSLKPAELADWYSVTAAAGDLTASVENVPTNITAHVRIFDSTGKEVEYKIGANTGANVSVTAMGITAGTYQIGVEDFAVAPDGFARADTPG